jgi:transposase InsO family protein
MAFSAIDPNLWEHYRARIEDLYYRQNNTLSDVIQALQQEGFSASSASYKRQLAFWNEQRLPDDQLRKYRKYDDDPKLIELVHMLWHRNWSPRRMLRCLNEVLGYPDITTKTLQRIRKQEGLVNRREKYSEEHRAAVEEAAIFIRKELEGGLSTRWGNVYTRTWTRKNIGHFVSRQDLRIILKTIDSIGTEARDKGEDRLKGRFMVKGPNRLWSGDQHDKLSLFGFQIYGIIDAFSRMIIGVFVGVSNRTQIAVLRFFLKCIRKHGGFPKKIRSDKGKETILMAVAQVALRRAQKPGLPYHKAYAYGPSTKNQ